MGNNGFVHVFSTYWVPGSACACVLSPRLCPTLCGPMDCMMPYRAPLSKGFSRQEYWSGLPRPPPGDPPRQCTKHFLEMISAHHQNWGIGSIVHP